MKKRSLGKAQKKLQGMIKVKTNSEWRNILRGVKTSNKKLTFRRSIGVREQRDSLGTSLMS